MTPMTPVAASGEAPATASPAPIASIARNACPSGHERAARLFLGAFEQRRHHAWMLSGARGIGKATLGYALARHVLHATAFRRNDAAQRREDGLYHFEAESPFLRRMDAGGHRDFFELTLEVARGEGEGAAAGKRRAATAIGIDDIRRLAAFCALTAAEGANKVVLIDSVDDLSDAACHALLKTLEEPPPHILFLIISHRPARAPATLRSRCLPLRLRPPPFETFQSILGQLAGRGGLEVPGTDEGEQWRRVYALSEGAPGVAASWFKRQAASRQSGDAFAPFNFSSLAALSPSACLEEAAAAAQERNDANWRLFRLRILHGVAQHLRNEAAAAHGERRAAALERGFNVWETCNRLFAATKERHLDRRQSALVILRAARRLGREGAAHV